MTGRTTPKNLGQSLLLVEYMEGNILSQDTTYLWDQILGEVHMSNNTFSTQASCPGGSGVGAVIGLSAGAGKGGAGVASQGSSRSRWTKRRVQTEIISPQKGTPTKPASQPSTSSQVLVSETRNADGREMGDCVPTQSSVVGGASEWSFL
ncbi:hypothetical protein Tco_0662095 [Tanacetum coccineum]